jgi:hypothetical protein
VTQISRIRRLAFQAVHDECGGQIRRIDPLWAVVILCAVVAMASVLAILAQVVPTAASWSEVIFH